jgi:hypothetical protein
MHTVPVFLHLKSSMSFSAINFIARHACKLSFKGYTVGSLSLHYHLVLLPVHSVILLIRCGYIIVDGLMDP